MIILFILGFVLGFLIYYMVSPKIKHIICYPTLDNVKSTTYIDEKGQCYRYHPRSVNCIQD